MHPDLHLVAGLLRRGRSLDQLSLALTLIAVAIGLSPLLGVRSSLMMALTCTLIVLVGLLEKYWALRVALDAELFERLATCERPDEHTHTLDQTLVRLGLQAEGHGNRSLESRCKGALGLLSRQAICLALQVLLVLTTFLTLPIFLRHG